MTVLNINDAVEEFHLAWLLHLMQFREEDLSPESFAGAA